LRQGKHLCAICGKSVKLKYHLKTFHADFTLETYFEKFLKKEGEGVCKNCGSETQIDWKNSRCFTTCSETCRWTLKGKQSSDFMRKRWMSDNKFIKNQKKVSKST
jgi:hypothetical protein